MAKFATGKTNCHGEVNLGSRLTYYGTDVGKVVFFAVLGHAGSLAPRPMYDANR